MSHEHHHEHHHDHAYMHEHGIAHSHGHVHENQKAVVNRLARALGHLEKVKRMVEEGYDCLRRYDPLWIIPARSFCRTICVTVWWMRWLPVTKLPLTICVRPSINL